MRLKHALEGTTVLVRIDFSLIFAAVVLRWRCPGLYFVLWLVRTNINDCYVSTESIHKQPLWLPSQRVFITPTIITHTFGFLCAAAFFVLRYGCINALQRIPKCGHSCAKNPPQRWFSSSFHFEISNGFTGTACADMCSPHTVERKAIWRCCCWHN